MKGKLLKWGFKMSKLGGFGVNRFVVHYLGGGLVVAEYWDESGKIIEIIEEAEDESLDKE